MKRRDGICNKIKLVEGIFFVFTLIFIGCNSIDAFAGNESGDIPFTEGVKIKVSEIKYDTNYVRTYPTRIGLALPVSTPFLKFALRDWGSARRLDFVPNQQYDFGIGAHYRFLNIVLGTGLSWSPNDIEKKGKTKYTDLQMHLYLRRIPTDIYFQRYKGFFLKNSQQFEGYTNNAPYEIRPDINAVVLSISSNYVFNHKKFSYRSAFAFSETQLKTAGSFLLGGYYSIFNVTADSGLISSSFRSAFKPGSNLERGTNQTIGFSLGYIHTYVFAKKYHFTLSAVQGAGYSGVKYKSVGHGPFNNGLKLSSKTSLSFSWGYDIGRIYLGAIALYDFYVFSNHKNVTLDYSNGKARIFIGYRFDLKKQKKKKQ